MCHVAKLYESVLEARLRRATEDTRGPWQHGFRKGVLNVAFLNLEKAFGRIPKVNYGRH